MSTIALLVLSFDGYSDLWRPFFECMNRYWKYEIPIYMTTNDMNPVFRGVSIIKTGPEISWSRRARHAIQAVEAEYFILMLEDYFLASPIDKKDLSPMLEFMKLNTVDYLRIYPFPFIDFQTQRNQMIHKLPETSLYGVNLQPSIWKKSFFLKLLGMEDYSAWEFEARQKNSSPMRMKGMFYTVNYYPFQMIHGVLQGKWIASSVRKLTSKGIYIDIYIRNMISSRKYLEYKMKLVIRKCFKPRTVKFAKPILRKVGIKFVTD